MIDDEATVHLTQLPALQLPFAVHECPQYPQLPPLVWRLTQTPLQFVCPLGQEQTPPVHVPPVHVCPAPQAPQYVVDVLRFTSQPLEELPSQLPKPEVHVPSVQAPLLQPAEAFGKVHAAQEAPAAPQLVGDSLA